MTKIHHSFPVALIVSVLLLPFLAGCAVNPATGGGLIIERHRAVIFRPSPLMQGLLNETGAAQDVDLDPGWDR